MYIPLQVRLVNIGKHDIVDGNPRITLGLIWSIIQDFQVCMCVLVGVRVCCV